MRVFSLGLILKNRDGTPSDLSRVIDVLVERSAREVPKKDSPCAVTGYQGTGKSTFSWEMCKEIGARMVDRGLIPAPWDPLNDAVWKLDKHEIKSKINAKKYAPFDFDEILAIANKHNWNQAIPLFLDDVFLTNRTQQRPYFLNGTRLGGFTETFRNQRVVFNFLLIKNGLGVLLRRHSDVNVTDPWFLKSLEKDITEQGKDKSETQDFLFGGDSLSFYENRINYVCTFRFTPLGKNDQAVYDKLRERITAESTALDSAKTVKEKSAVNETRLVNTAQNLLLQGKDVKEIAAIMGTNTIAVNNLLKKSVLDIQKG